MDELNKYMLKGMIISLQDALNEDNLDEFKKINQLISERIGSTKEVKSDEVSDNTTFKKTGCQETDKFIELLMTDNQQELFKIFETNRWSEKYKMMVVYDRIESVKNMNPSILHMMGYCIGSCKIINEKTAKYYYEQCWKTHRYAAYNLYISTNCTKDFKKSVEYLEKSAELGYTKSYGLLSECFCARKNFDKAAKYAVLDYKHNKTTNYLINPDIIDVLLKKFDQ
jgi:hypothetical protein